MRSRRARSSAKTRRQGALRGTKLTVWNGLTAEGLASPLVCVTRLCEVVPPSWCLEERRTGGGGGGKSTPSSAARRASLPG